jgi:hypothetical protein
MAQSRQSLLLKIARNVVPQKFSHAFFLHAANKSFYLFDLIIAAAAKKKS